MEVKLTEMNWLDVEEAFKKPNVVILPVGATEQHGLHLPLNVDSCLATYFAEQAARKITDERKVRVLVAPTIDYSDTSGFAGFPGTIGISVDTLIRMIEDIVRGFISQGVKNIIVLNGHYGNIFSIGTALRKLSIEFPEAGLYAVSWWTLGFEVIPKIRKSEITLHADELETSLCLVIQPEKVHLDKAVKEYPSYSLSEKWAPLDLYSPSRVLYHSRRKLPRRKDASGVMGDATVASKETGEKVISAVVDDLAEIILEIVKSGEAPPKTR